MTTQNFTFFAGREQLTAEKKLQHHHLLFHISGQRYTIPKKRVAPGDVLLVLRACSGPHLVESPIARLF